MNGLEFQFFLLVASAVVLAAIAVTGFGAETAEGRFVSGLGAVAAGAYAYYLGFVFEGGTYLFSIAPMLVPVLAGIALVRGFRNRKNVRAERQAMKAGKKAADEWRATRRW